MLEPNSCESIVLNQPIVLHIWCMSIPESIYPVQPSLSGVNVVVGGLMGATFGRFEAARGRFC